MHLRDGDARPPTRQPCAHCTWRSMAPHKATAAGWAPKYRPAQQSSAPTNVPENLLYHHWPPNVPSTAHPRRPAQVLVRASATWHGLPQCLPRCHVAPTRCLPPVVAEVCADVPSAVRPAGRPASPHAPAARFECRVHPQCVRRWHPATPARWLPGASTWRPCARGTGAGRCATAIGLAARRAQTCPGGRAASQCVLQLRAPHPLRRKRLCTKWQHGRPHPRRQLGLGTQKTRWHWLSLETPAASTSSLLYCHRCCYCVTRCHAPNQIQSHLRAAAHVHCT